MGKKGALTAVFSRSKSNKSGVDSPPWPWPSCGDPQTDSFRAGGEPCASAASGSRCGPVASRHRKLVGAAGGGEMYKTVNSVYFDPDGGESCSGLKAGEDDGDEWVVVEDDGLPTATAACAEEDLPEAVIRSLSRTTLSTHRFFFDQDRPATNSILPAASSPAGSAPPEEEEEEDKPAALSEKEKQPGPGDGGKSLVAEESVAVAVESADPHQDFLASMEEMVAAHGLRGWDALEELLVWYLRVNAKRHHPLIVSAFVDLLLRLTTGTPSATSTTVTTSSSSTSTGSSASIGSSTSTSTSTTASTGSNVITTAAAAAGQCRGGKEASASCSSSSSSCVPSGFGEAGRGEG
ncbi:transcription repressor OFP13 [Lolium perenne]|uniref:transcription repressor OFP13 n=1 Tax=Lolium perenne TaxID=4522 RepID=UPI0021EA58E0|nr:transcription repressor OFP13-like [Lolium perenne]